jgi:ribosomal protein S18 acetylase RimI-like enzyme
MVGRKHMFDVRPATFEQILAAHALIPEFNLGGEYYFRDRLVGKTSLSLIAWDGDTMAGYAVAYLEGDAVYIWLAGTAPDYRGRGVYSRIFEHIRRWPSAQASAKLRLKTTNSFPAMLRWLVKNGFMFVAIEPGETPMENRIIAERPL